MNCYESSHVVITDLDQLEFVLSHDVCNDNQSSKIVDGIVVNSSWVRIRCIETERIFYCLDDITSYWDTLHSSAIIAKIDELVESKFSFDDSLKIVELVIVH